MRVVQALMMLLGALAVLMIGAAPADAHGDLASAPPCHEVPAHHPDVETPSPEPGKAMKAMDCCVAVMTQPALRSPERARLIKPRPPAAGLPMALPAGERPAPEPHPPRPAFL